MKEWELLKSRLASKNFMNMILINWKLEGQDSDEWRLWD